MRDVLDIVRKNIREEIVLLNKRYYNLAKANFDSLSEDEKSSLMKKDCEAQIQDLEKNTEEEITRIKQELEAKKQDMVNEMNELTSN